MHRRITKTEDHIFERFTNLWQRLFSPIRIDWAVDVAGLALFRTGDGPHMCHQFTPRQLLLAHSSGVEGTFVLPHWVGTSAEWPYPPLHKGGNQMHTRDAVQEPSNCLQHRRCFRHFFSRKLIVPGFRPSGYTSSRKCWGHILVHLHIEPPLPPPRRRVDWLQGEVPGVAAHLDLQASDWIGPATSVVWPDHEDGLP